MIVTLVLQRHQALFRDHPRAYKLRWPIPPVRFKAAFAQSIHTLAPRVIQLPAEQRRNLLVAGKVPVP